MKKIFLAVLLFCAMAAVTVKVTAHGGVDDEGLSPVSVSSGPSSRVFMPKESQFLIGVRTILSQTKNKTRKIYVLGSVIPTTRGQGEVYAPVPGRIAPEFVKQIPDVGSTVRENQVVAVVQQVLEPSSKTQFISQKLNAESSLLQAQQELQLAEKVFARKKTLIKIVALKDIQEAEANVKIAEARVQQLQKELSVLTGLLEGGEKNINTVPVRAPISGIIIEAHLAAGEFVNTEKQLFKIIDLSRLWIEANVYESEIESVMGARSALVSSTAYPDRFFDAKLFRMGNAMDTETRSVKALFEVQNPQKLLKPGMTMEVGIDTNKMIQGVFVPVSAVNDVDGKQMVFVHDTPEFFSAVEVNVGQKVGDEVQIVKGIEAGERVVTTGSYQVSSLYLRGGR